MKKLNNSRLNVSVTEAEWQLILAFRRALPLFRRAERTREESRKLLERTGMYTKTGKLKKQSDDRV